METRWINKCITKHYDRCNKKTHSKSREWLTLSEDGRENIIEENTGISICFTEKKKKEGDERKDKK